MSHTGIPDHSDASHEIAAVDDEKTIERIVALANATEIQLMNMRRTDVDMQVNMLPAPASKPDKRTAEIIDSIAAVLVTRPGGPVYAVGASIKHDLESNQGHVSLILAENADVDATTKLYLEELWKLLQNLSQEYSSYLPEDSPLKRRDYLQETPPKGAHIPDGYYRLAITVYKRAFRKFKSRLNKAHTALTALEIVFRSHIYPGLPLRDNGTRVVGFYNALFAILTRVILIRKELTTGNQQGSISRELLLWMKESFEYFCTFTKEDFEQMDRVVLHDDRVRELLYLRRDNYTKSQSQLTQPSFFRQAITPYSEKANVSGVGSFTTRKGHPLPAISSHFL